MLAGWILVEFNYWTSLGQIDFDQVWWAARCLLDGQNPYHVIRPPRFHFQLYYPLTSAVLALPLGLLDFRSARLAMVVLSGALYGFAIGRYRPWLWPTFLGIPFIMFATGGQWSALLAAAVLLPWLGVVAAAKPNVGLAVLIGARSGRAVVIQVGGSLLLLGISLAVDPGWPLAWKHALDQSSHFRPLIMRPGGFLMLLALLRWRDADARLLLALAIVPTTGLYYDFLPAGLVARNLRQSAFMSLLTQVAWIAAPGFPVYEPYALWSWRAGIMSLWVIMVPALAIVLWRGQEPDPGSVLASDPAGVKWAVWRFFRGRSAPDET